MTPPTDADLWGTLLAGPFGFVVAIAIFAYLGIREWRKGRALDVTEARQERDEAEADAKQRVATEKELRAAAESQTREIQRNYDKAQSEHIEIVRQLNKQHAETGEEAYARLAVARQMLLDFGIKREDLP